MKISQSVALVTGANRGFGRALVNALGAAGASKIYACARDPRTIEAGPGLHPVALDITRPEDVARAARACGDVNLLINNAGIAGQGDLLEPSALADLRRMFETNVLGMVAMTQAFAPALARAGGGVVVDILSVLSWLSLPGAGAYSASKAAAWSVTNGLRHALRGQGTRVIGVHVSFMDTEMTAKVDAPKTDPGLVAQMVLAAVEKGDDEVVADADSRAAKSALSSSTSYVFA